MDIKNVPTDWPENWEPYGPPIVVMPGDDYASIKDGEFRVGHFEIGCQHYRRKTDHHDAEIDRLRAENQRMRDALMVFANAGYNLPPSYIRRAAEALKGTTI